MTEIERRSDSFFEAMSVLRGLSQTIHTACGQIGKLRGAVQAMDAKLLRASERLNTLHRERANLRAVDAKLRTVERVSEARAALEVLVQSADFAGALEAVRAPSAKVSAVCSAEAAEKAKSERPDLDFQIKRVI